MIKANDIVLSNSKAVDLNSIYKTHVEIREISVCDHSVAVIPNSKNFKYGDREKIYSLYHKMIARLLVYGKTVYLLFHSSEDKAICEKIYEDYANDPHVIFVGEEFSSLEFDSMIGKFDYVIASRFHSIVHAYKNATPALIMGWATKYTDLASMFNQRKYQFNIVSDFDEDELFASLDHLNCSYHSESKNIADRLKEYQAIDLFDLVKL